MGSPVAAKLVGYESSRYPALTFQQFAEEALSRSTVSAALDQDVDRIAVLIHSSPQVVALTLDRDEEFIQVPGVAQTTLPSFQGSSVSRAEFATPLPNRLVGDNDTALSRTLGDSCLLNTVSDGIMSLWRYRSPSEASPRKCATSLRRVRRCNANPCRNSSAVSWSGSHHGLPSVSGCKEFAIVRKRRELACRPPAF